MEVLNISSDSEDERARRLSNFSADPFILGFRRFASVEGFIQGIKFPERSIARGIAFRSVGVEAKRFGKNAERKFVWWNAKKIPYGSPAHYQLIEKAIRAKFAQNEGAMSALLATKGMHLSHDIGKPEPKSTSLPAAVFCDILTRIREEALLAHK